MDDNDIELLQMYILDVLRHDVAEPLQSIVKLLNNDGCIGWRGFWPRDFTAQEVWNQLDRLVRIGLVQAFVYDTTSGQLAKVTAECSVKELLEHASWFGLTEHGRRILDAWVPPTELEDEPSGSDPGGV